jgi:hypothetical protein
MVNETIKSENSKMNPVKFDKNRHQKYKTSNHNLIKRMNVYWAVLLVLFLSVLNLQAGETLQKEIPVIPGQDPKPEKQVNLKKEVQDVHPRLLFTPDEIPALRKLAHGEGKKFFEQIESYLPASNPPDHTDFLHDATDGQRQGLWKMPTAAIHYIITGEQNSFNKALGFLKVLIGLEHWEEGGETDSGMSAANIMIGAAIVYDCLYNDMDPEFREAFREKLLLQARRMYYFGHMNYLNSGGYWKQDPQNNHRWHRNAGLALSVLAVADKNRKDDDWILAKTLEELQFIAKWLPDDGTSHESPSYMILGAGHLTLAMDAADNCLGTDFMGTPFFKSLPSFRMQTLTPGFTDVFCYGDCGGFGLYNNFLFRSVSEHQLKDHLDATMKLYETHENAFAYGWWSLIWYDPMLERGNYEDLPHAKLFPDLGLGIMRDGWQKEDVGFMLKCIPYAGERLLEYRKEYNNSYINIAHDDPDANTFLLYTDGEMVADYDAYANPKLTSSHNTILVNGEGQRHDGKGWTQPIENMQDLATVTTWKVTDDAVIMEGEAGNAYEALDRYRRAVIWIPGSYILLVDDIRAKSKSGITWLIQSDNTQIVDRKTGHYRIEAENGGKCDFYMASNTDVSPEIGISTANHRGKKMGYKQLHVTANTNQWRVATVFDAWHKGKIQVTLEEKSEGSAVITIKGPDFHDTVNWEYGQDQLSPASFRISGSHNISP